MFVLQAEGELHYRIRDCLEGSYDGIGCVWILSSPLLDGLTDSEWGNNQPVQPKYTDKR
jgi:hypothetical protein